MKLRASLILSVALTACGNNPPPTRPDASADAPAADAPSPDAPSPDAPTTDVPTPDAPAPDAPQPTDTPATDGGVIPGSTVTYTETRAACRDRNPLRNAYFGDLHVHTSLSFDAYGWENRNDPAAAYRFARGETIRLAPLGADGVGTRPVHLDRPLDFAAVTDHSEFLGEVSICTTPSATGYDSLICRGFRSGGMVGFAEFGAQLARTNPSRYPFCGAGDANCLMTEGRIWRDVRNAAEGAYDRTADCRFTSFVAYEWTGTTAGANLHRNVIFRNASVPDLPVTYIDQPTAPGLWATLRQRCNTMTPGCDALAIPHNANLSNGRMFAVEYPAGSTMEQQRQAAALRAEMEPLVEMVQHKGASECDRAYSASDEACGFEIARTGPMCAGTSGMTDCVSRANYVRYALQSGLAEEARLGVNPHRLGVIASTDTHNSTPGNTAEETFPGHVGTQDDQASEQLGDTLKAFSPGGLAGVWAVENSRDAIFDAIRRRETFGTSGTRIRVRMFGGWGFTPAICSDPELVRRGYTEGVPQGASLPDRTGTNNPRFVVVATADRTPLQRVEVVKVWIDRDGHAQERVVVVAGSASNGSSVDASTCATTPGAGQMSLCGVWTDDQYDPSQRAAYYTRVLENPTCRWSTRACNGLPAAGRPAACTDGSIPRTIQERAWSSPIFYSPR